jgi:ferredoxin
MPYKGTGNILSWMTPEVIFSTGYCLETCNLCSTVCPTGAITLFDIRAKEGLVMGTAVINLENCLLFNNTECVKCRESCKYDAIVFTAHGNILNMAPVINNEKCTGCGACKVICPQSCIEINGLA